MTMHTSLPVPDDRLARKLFDDEDELIEAHGQYWEDLEKHVDEACDAINGKEITHLKECDDRACEWAKTLHENCNLLGLLEVFMFTGPPPVIFRGLMTLAAKSTELRIRRELRERIKRGEISPVVREGEEKVNPDDSDVTWDQIFGKKGNSDSIPPASR